jgi:hypothetical protein
VIADEVRPYTYAAIHWLKKRDYNQANNALKHINKILDEKETKHGAYDALI